MSDDILRAYHRKIGLHREKTGVSYPLTRVSCVDTSSGEIFDTRGDLVATFTFDSLDRVRIKLIES
jgi:hypothetical protein